MLKRCGTVVAALAMLVSQSACYTTRVITDTRPEGPPYTDRQWFLIGGLAPVSPPAGRECRHGLSYAESKLSATDWLIDIGLGAAGGLIGGVACSGTSDPLALSSCISAGAALVPFLVSSRTVEYACAAGDGGGGGDFRPPRHPASAPPGYGPPPPGYAPPQGPPPGPPPAP